MLKNDSVLVEVRRVELRCCSKKINGLHVYLIFLNQQISDSNSFPSLTETVGGSFLLM